MYTIEEQSTILDAAAEPPTRKIAYFTSLCVLRSGTVLCGFQNGPAKHASTSTIRICRSQDSGRTWRLQPTQFETRFRGVAGSLGAAEILEAAPGRVLLFATWFDRSDPDRPLFDPVTEGILRSRQLLSVSTDDGQTWSPWRELSTGDLKACALTGPVLQWPHGLIAFPFESFKEYDDPEPGRHAAWIMVSRDRGATFSSPLLVAQHPSHEIYYWDQRLCAGSGLGDFTAMFWTHDLVGKRDLNVHLRQCAVVGDRIVAGPMRATPISGQIAAPLLLHDGRLLALVVDRGQPGTIALWCSADGGQTWPAANRLVVYRHDERAVITQGRDNVDFKQYWEDMGKWSFGHPALRRLADDRLLLAWYAGAPDCMSLHCARVCISRK
jgi:hypothetical protein